MFMTNARLFWTHMNKMEPETVTHLGDYPEVTRELDLEEIKFITNGETDDIKSESDGRADIQ